MRKICVPLWIGLWALAGCSKNLVAEQTLLPPSDDEPVVPTLPTDDPPDDPPPDDPPDDPPPDDPPDDPPPDDPPDDPPPDDPPPDDPPDDPPPEPLDCGQNASEINGACECDTIYTLCDATDETQGCCAYGIETFQISLISANVIPFKDPTDQQPWDWSGSVPGWLFDVMAELAVYINEDAAQWVDIADFVLDFAPELVEGSTPPDPFVDVQIDEHTVYMTEVDVDTIEPVWNEVATVTVLASNDLVLRYRDEDPFQFDDNIGEIPLSQADLQHLAGVGTVVLSGVDAVYDYTIEIQPVP